MDKVCADFANNLASYRGLFRLFRGENVENTPQILQQKAEYCIITPSLLNGFFVILKKACHKL